MKRYLIILTLYLCAVVPTMAQYYSVNYDKRTVEAMTAAFATEAATEAYLEGTKRSVYLRESPKMMEEPRIEIVR